MPVIRRGYGDSVNIFGPRAPQGSGHLTVGDSNRGADRYVAGRKQWDSYINRLAPAGLYSLEEIDPATKGGHSARTAA